MRLDKERRALAGVRTRLRTGVSLLFILALGVGLSGSHVIPPSDGVDAGVEAPPGLSGMDRYLLRGSDPEDRDSALAALRTGLELREGDADAARTAFASAARRLPAFADWAHLLAADAAARAGDVRLVEKHLEETAPELAADRGWRARVRAYRAAQDLAGAIRAAAEAQPTPPVERVEARVMLGELRLLARDTAGAIAAFRSAVDSFPGYSRSVDAARALSSLRQRTNDDRLRIGTVYLRHGNMDRAIDNLDAYIDARGGTAAERAQLRLRIGRALFDAREYRTAIQRMTRLAALDVAPEVAAEALLVRGRSQYRLDQVTAGRASLLAAVERAPRSEIAAHALFILGDMDHDAGRITAASANYGKAVTAAPGSAIGMEAGMRMGAIAYLAGNYTNAARSFEQQLGTRAGSARQRAGYWTALTLERSGAKARADSLLRDVVQQNPLSYYGMRAAERIDAPSPRRKFAPAPAPAPETRLRIENALLRLDILRELKLGDAATYENDRVQRHLGATGEAGYALAEALNERGELLRGIRMGRAIERSVEQTNERLLRIIHPFPYRDIIEREARRNGLDPYFVVALIRQESLFNPRARSGPGAIGLMQVMPRTGTQVARNLGIRNFKPEMLEDPAINVRIGTVILADLIRSYNGRTVDVLIAYNAGGGRLSRWRRHAEYRDPELFIERIPYEETRDYVRIVQENAFNYRVLYGE